MIQRYNIYGHDFDTCQESDGDYVTYEDHQQAMALKASTIAALEAEIRAYQRETSRGYTMKGAC